MKKPTQDRTSKESKLAVVVITDGTSTRLITSDGVYLLGKQGNLLSAKPHEESYASSVKGVLKEIGERLAIGQFGGQYHIEYDGKLNIPIKFA